MMMMRVGSHSYLHVEVTGATTTPLIYQRMELGFGD